MLRCYFRNHKALSVVLASAAALLGILLLAVALFDWNALRGPIAREIRAKTGRSASIDGDLKAHIWSWTPSVDVHGLHIGNPDWTNNPVMFSADRVTVSVSLGRLLRGQIVLPRVEMLHPALDLERDAQGRASWEFTNSSGTPKPTSGKPTKLPTVRLLIIRDGQVAVTDKIKQLSLKGSLNAGEKAGQSEHSAFQLRLVGTLNAKPLKVKFDGGPLLKLNPNTPYDFTADIFASTLHVDANVSIIKPFDLSEFSAKLHLKGADLADAYYLTGLALPNTAPYDMSGDVHRTSALFQIDALKGRIGASDISGTLSIDTSQKRPAMKAKLVSKNLDIKDLAPTLGAPPTPPADNTPATQTVAHRHGAMKEMAAAAAKSDRLLPDADLQLNRVRGMDADVTYHAESVTAPKLKVKEVRFHLVLTNGDLKLDPLSFVLNEGTIAGGVDIDARQAAPETSIDMHVTHVDLREFKSAKAAEAPLSGELYGRLHAHGFGSSIHKLASSADGGLALAIPHGEINDVIAELMGINVLKAFGLIFTNDTKQAAIRCGVVDFEANKGALAAKSLFIDTTNVLITGRGRIDLSTENIDLSLQGDPKHLQLLRIRAPITVTGTLRDPAFGIKGPPLALQTAEAVALGTLLTPFAAALAFVDPGLAKDANCAAILQQEAAVGPDAPGRH